MNLMNKIFGDPNDKIIKSIRPTVDAINALEEKYKNLSQDELKAETISLKEELVGKSLAEQKILLDKILPSAFALIREAASRVLGQRHYDVQLVGGIVLHRGQIAEMKTGEGKTLVATLPLFLNALTGGGAHLITVNDYLSKVGAGWMAAVYDFLDLSTGVIVHDTAFIYDRNYVDDTQYDERLCHFRKVSRQEAYAADITYGTNNEFGFDYLRDNMVSNLDQMVQRDLNYAIVDEIDSILIDEARTPLIISGSIDERSDKYNQFSRLVRNLKDVEHYVVDEKMRTVSLTENGLNQMEKLLGLDNIYVEGGVREVHHIEQALKAEVLFKRDKDYVVKDGEVVIVDEFTGRMMPGRRYSEGLHQAIEAKEGVEIQKESQTLATVTFQNYFRMYEKLSGMTGTALTEAEEFHKIYGLETVAIPTNKPNVRKDGNDLIYSSEEGKYMAVINDIKERQKAGQPVLVGTISIEKNEYLANLMEREGLEVSLLNAKNHFKEAEIISQAGRPGAVTLATNMAGRGVDIILGGNPPDKEDQKKVIAAGGLHVVGTERHESRRIDNQLRGRAGRQGDPGSSQFYISVDDDLMRVFGGDRLKNMMKTLKVPADMPIENSMVSKSIESAQKRVEGNNFDIRKHLVEYDDVINKHRGAIYKRRKEVLLASEERGERELSASVLELVEEEIAILVNFSDVEEIINVDKIAEEYKAITGDNVKDLIVDIKTADEIKEKLVKLAQEKYGKMKEAFSQANMNFAEIEKGIMLKSIDVLWIEHLETIDYLRKGIGLRGYGQRDPLVEYKKEAFHLYHDLLDLIRRQIVYSIYKTGEALSSFSGEKLAAMSSAANRTNIKYQAPEKTAIEQHSHMLLDVVPDKLKNEKGEKVGRNDLCPCGSGKKYKKCCGK